MVEERRLAEEEGRIDPICDGYDATTEMYHSVLDYVLPLITSDRAGIMIASHNEDTVAYGKKR